MIVCDHILLTNLTAIRDLCQSLTVSGLQVDLRSLLFEPDASSDVVEFDVLRWSYDRLPKDEHR